MSSTESESAADTAMFATPMIGRRVMESITRFITHNLKLQVNETKSAVAQPEVSWIQLHCWPDSLRIPRSGEAPR